MGRTPQPAKRKDKPTNAEVAILRVLWSRGPSTVREVARSMGREDEYTTILKLLQNMTAKRLVRHASGCVVDGRLGYRVGDLGRGGQSKLPVEWQRSEQALDAICAFNGGEAAPPRAASVPSPVVESNHPNDRVGR